VKIHDLCRVMQFQVENICLLVSISQHFSAEDKKNGVHIKVSILITAIR